MNNQQFIKDQLYEQDIELDGMIVPGENGLMKMEVLKLYPVASVEAEPIYMAIPLVIEAAVDDAGLISSLSGTEPSGPVLEEARRFLEQLIATNELNGFRNMYLPKASHKLVKDQKGRKVVRRQLFHGYGL
ncbi:MAG TPA: hypothetical protein VFR58_11975 [Flavisolibacter sp.]|nr:hypothetical protein [Flavisolibacter sp.]